MAKNKPKNKPKKNHEKPREEKAVEPMSVNVEIDYGKLATAMIQAKEMIKDETEEKITKDLFSFLTAWVFRVIAFMGFCIALGSLIYGIYHAVTVLQWIDWIHIIANIFTCIVLLVMIVCIGLLSFMLFVSGNEIEKSKDKNFVISVFSALSGFIALIVALIALF